GRAGGLEQGHHRQLPRRGCARAIADTDANPGSGANAHADAGSDANTHADPNAHTHTGANTHTGADTKPDAGADAITDTRPDLPGGAEQQAVPHDGDELHAVAGEREPRW